MAAHSTSPRLTFELLERRDEFPPYDMSISEQEVHRYVEVTGDDNPEYRRFIPPGFAAIFGRAAYLQHYRMPPGGVLLSEQIQWFRPVQIGATLRVQARVKHTERSGPKRKAIIATEACHDGELVARVHIEAGWPT